MTKKFHLTAILVIALFLLVAGCGTSNVGTMGVDQVADDRLTAGVVLGGYEVLRYNADGFPDPALNDSLTLRLDGGDLIISVADAGLNYVGVGVNYDGSSTYPGTVKFHGMFDSDDMLSASFTDKAGIAGLGSAPIGGAELGSFDTEYATISFEPGMLRTVSAPGDVHHGNVGQSLGGDPNLFGEGDTTARTATVSWTTAFHTADGDQNSETNQADLQQIALFFGQDTSVNWAAEVGDYDDNGEVNLGDIQQIALFYLEGSQGFSVQFADNTGVLTGTPLPAPVLWADATGPTGPPVVGDFFTAFDNWSVEINDTTSPSYGDIAALDANADGFINAIVANVTFAGGPPTIGQTGIQATVLVPVGGGVVTVPAEVVITGYGVLIASDDVDTVFDQSSNDLSVEANKPLVFELQNVYGTFDGEPFDKDTLPTVDDKTMTQENFDDVFAKCQEKLQWNFANAGHTDIRRTANWVVLNSAQWGVVTGDPGGGTVFPDDDPQSVDPLVEGLLTTTLPSGGPADYVQNLEIEARVLANVNHVINVDVTADPLAAVINDFGGQTELQLVEGNDVQFGFDFGTNGEPADLTGILFQLVPIDLATGLAYDPVDRNWVSLDYVDSAPDLGEFTLFIFGDIAQVFANINGAELQSGTNYSPRIQVEGVWSSINKPDETLATVEFEAGPVAVLPRIGGPEVTQIQIFPLDPQVRRNGAQSFDLLTGVAIYEDKEAYDDILKISPPEDLSTSAFPIEYDPETFTTYPRIVVIDGDDPSLITGPNDPNHKAGVSITRRQGNKVVVDIAVIPRPGDPGGDLDYAFRLFAKDGHILGEDTFNIVGLDLGTQEPIGIDWSVNLFDRVEAAVADRNHDFPNSHRVNGLEVNTIEPPVLWFEFSGGWLYGGPFRDPVEIELLEVGGVETMPMNLRVEIAGLTPAGDVLAFHTVVIADYFNPIEPTGGILRPGESYIVKIRESTNPLPPFEYTDRLTCINSPF